jgi:hypothetical protein
MKRVRLPSRKQVMYGHIQQLLLIHLTGYGNGSRTHTKDVKGNLYRNSEKGETRPKTLRGYITQSGKQTSTIGAIKPSGFSPHSCG